MNVWLKGVDLGPPSGAQKCKISYVRSHVHDHAVFLARQAQNVLEDGRLDRRPYMVLPEIITHDHTLAVNARGRNKRSQRNRAQKTELGKKATANSISVGLIKCLRYVVREKTVTVQRVMP